jgi:hypothetical protein
MDKPIVDPAREGQAISELQSTSSQTYAARGTPELKSGLVSGGNISSSSPPSDLGTSPPPSKKNVFVAKFWGGLRKLASFLGPGAIVSVAYIDPDNYQTAISSGASFQYKLLFMILVSNIIAIYLQVCLQNSFILNIC